MKSVNKKTKIKEIKRLLEDTRRKFQLASMMEDTIFKQIEELGICDPQSIPSNAENADNLHDAISCYLLYGEYGVDNIIKELREASSDILVVRNPQSTRFSDKLDDELLDA